MSKRAVFIGKKLKKILHPRTQAWLISETGIDKSTMSRILSDSKVPDFSEVVAICKALRIFPSQLVPDDKGVKDVPEKEAADRDVEADLRVAHPLASEIAELVLTGLKADPSLRVGQTLTDDEWRLVRGYRTRDDLRQGFVLAFATQDPDLRRRALDMIFEEAQTPEEKKQADVLASALRLIEPSR